MSGGAVSKGVGRIVAGENDSLLKPSELNLDRPPVVYCHGAGGNGWAATGGASYPEKLFCDAVMTRGFYLTCVSHGLAFGADPITTPTTGRIALTIAAARTLGRASATKKAAIIGASMGSFEAAKAVARDPTSYQCAVYMLPVFSLQNLRDVDPSGYGLRTLIDAAYPGNNYPLALPAGADVFGNSTFVSALATVPSLIIHSGSDAVSHGDVGHPFDLTTFAATIGATLVNQETVLGHTVGHNFELYTQTDALILTMLDFIESHTD